MALHHGMAIKPFNRRWLDNVLATARTNIFFLKQIIYPTEKHVANFHEQAKGNSNSCTTQ